MLCLQFPKALLIMEGSKKAPEQLYLVIIRKKFPTTSQWITTFTSLEPAAIWMRLAANWREEKKKEQKMNFMF